MWPCSVPTVIERGEMGPQKSRFSALVSLHTSPHGVLRMPCMSKRKREDATEGGEQGEDRWRW